MALRISVFNSKELQGVIVAMNGMEKELSKQIRRATKTVIQPVWKQAVAENANTRLESRVLAQTARVAVSNQNVTLSSASIGRTFAGGSKPHQLMHSAEFGADRTHTATYRATSRKGKSYTVNKRHTRAQFRPAKRKGYVVYPALADTIPRIASLWVQTTVRTFYELIEKR